MKEAERVFEHLQSHLKNGESQIHYHRFSGPVADESRMKIFSNNITQRFATALLCMVLLALMLFSGLLILIEHEHDCSGKECPVCALIDQAEATLTCLGVAEPISEAWVEFSNEKPHAWIRPSAPTHSSFTLVQLKVRQNK